MIIKRAAENGSGTCSYIYIYVCIHSLHHDSVYDHLSNRVQHEARASPELLSVFFPLPFQFVEGHVSQDFKWHLKRFYGCCLPDEFCSVGDVIDDDNAR